jgi:hypothetical protein
MWLVRPQLFFFFFSAFEDLRLRTTGTMESNGASERVQLFPWAGAALSLLH